MFSNVQNSNSTSLVLERINVVDVRNGSVLEEQTVVIAGGSIRSIQPSHTVSGLKGQRIDADGKYLIPGFNDMHAHVLSSEDPERSLSLMLAHGVTGFRQMSASESLLQQRLRNGRYLSKNQAPDLLAMSGPIVTRLTVRTKQQALQEVERQEALGADFIKVVDSSPESLVALLKAAKARSIPVAGHLPESVNETLAANIGMKSIEHLGPRSSVVMGCSNLEEALREKIANNPHSGPPELPAWLASLIKPLTDRMFRKIVVNPYIVSTPTDFDIMNRILTSFDEQKCVQFAQQLALQDTWQVPTLVRIRTMSYGGDADYRSSPDLRFVSSETLASWNSVADEFTSELSSEQRATLEQFFELQAIITAILAEQGVKMLAGSDVGGGWLVPGISLHEEFDLLDAAGVQPLRVLKMATADAAAFLELGDELGLVEVGKRANLVLLDRNPLQRVSNLHGVHAVIRAGNYYDRDELQRLKVSAQYR
ncbi:amidohydrolase family protein [Pseudomaricurvus alkylphenolicus]|uniref:amidohydrolase family protein n=1 Tax=Pseudomaricurvus alkylphenolicus TaxID=1306991 RepID=UPI00141DE8BE|nr:amidohydrolase family protein [Pseudomaricurvus alkylphenolicus]NIB43408.1 amidohydrolase family protein [Pseudomaricurvus alkylphenolicus]